MTSDHVSTVILSNVHYIQQVNRIPKNWARNRDRFGLGLELDTV